MPKPKNAPRFGSKTYEEVLSNNQKYGNDPIWLGPRGRDYGAMLDNPKPYQIANLYPDPNSSYWIGQFHLPEGSALILKGRFPHCRYTEFALYRPDPFGSFTATSEALTDDQIVPDEGSINPFLPGNSRTSENRSYTVRIIAKEAPRQKKDREPNTLYAGAEGAIQMCLRYYLPDLGRDATGDVGLPGCEGIAADGTPVSATKVRKLWNQPMSEGIASGMTVDEWVALRDAPDNDPDLDPAAIPARTPPVPERFLNNDYNFTGVFKSAATRAGISHRVETGFGGSSNITYLFCWISRVYGPVLVLRGKMPKYPVTIERGNDKGLETMTDWEVRYWSIVIGEAPPSGLSNDGLSDFQIPLDKDGNYTIVVSRKEDRPVNATEESGIAWIEWSERGEGLDSSSNRADFGLLIIRFLHANLKWKSSPAKVLEPGTEAQVMGLYCPRGEYMDKATFEAKGP